MLVVRIRRVVVASTTRDGFALFPSFAFFALAKREVVDSLEVGVS
jgi:hypothetical protein